jgi:hypothetical protein
MQSCCILKLSVITFMPERRIAVFKIEKMLLGLTIGAIFPILGLLTGWWGGFALLQEKSIPSAALAGLAAGFVIDFIFLKKWITGAYAADLKICMAVYAFFSFGMLGFFMGVPVFNVGLALPAGLYIGGRLARRGAGADEANRLSRGTCLFTTSVMAVVCLISAIIALAHPYTGSEIEGMLRLPFAVTPLMLAAIIALGGIVLLLLQWIVTAAVIRRTLSVMQTKIGATLPAVK